MATAWIDGEPTSRDDATELAADLLRPSRLPLLGGLASDAVGLRAAMRFARRVGAVVDHHAGEAIAPFVSAFRDGGMMLGAPAEMRRRADRILAVGPEALADESFAAFLLEGKPDLGQPTQGVTREILWIGGPETLPTLPDGLEVKRFDCEANAICDVVATLRAKLAGHPCGDTAVSREHADAMVAWLRAAGFGCCVFAADRFDALTLEVLAGLVSELNAGTRFTCLPVMPSGGAWDAVQIATAATGFPLRVSFARGHPEHDPHRFAADALVAQGEADVAVYLANDACPPAPPEWFGRIPTIAIVAAGDHATLAQRARVVFEVAVPGRQVAGARFDRRFGTFAAAPASQPDASRPEVGSVFGAIAERLDSLESRDGAAA